jgi:hypothetical protein
MSGLTPQEQEALRTSGSWPNVGTDIFAAVERIVAAREAAAAEQARAEAWDEGAEATAEWAWAWGSSPPGPNGPIDPPTNPYRAALATEPTP